MLIYVIIENTNKIAFFFFFELYQAMFSGNTLLVCRDAQINNLNCFFFDKVVKKVKLSLVRPLKQIIIWSVKIVENKKKTFVYQEAIIQAFNTSLFT